MQASLLVTLDVMQGRLLEEQLSMNGYALI